MKSFDIERKGYNKKEVDNYIEVLNKQHEDSIEEKQQELMQVQAELMQLKMELESYQSKDDQISKALVVAVETAKEIESSAKTIYELEIKRVKVLYKKWNNILNEIKALYPDINKINGVSTLFNEFEDAINKILSKEDELAKMPSNVNKTAEKIYAKTLLSRMWGNNQPIIQNEIKEIPKIRRKDRTRKIEQIINHDAEGDFEKFLKSEFDDFDNYQYKNSHKDAEVQTDKKSNYLNVLEQNLSKNQNEEDTFNMLEALKPKEDLMDIMKSFNLDE